MTRGGASNGARTTLACLTRSRHLVMRLDAASPRSFLRQNNRDSAGSSPTSCRIPGIEYAGDSRIPRWRRTIPHRRQRHQALEAKAYLHKSNRLSAPRTHRLRSDKDRRRLNLTNKAHTSSRHPHSSQRRAINTITTATMATPRPPTRLRLLPLQLRQLLLLLTMA